jgi:hypothetical protein
LKSLSQSEISEYLYDINLLKCQQWALNKLIKTVTENEGDKLSFSNLTLEEQGLRGLLRIDADNIYTPLKTEKDNESAFEIYPAIHCTWDVVKFPETKIKEICFTKFENQIEDIGWKIGKNNKEIYDELTELLKTLKKQLKEKEFKVNCVRMAATITNKSPFMWEECTEKDKKTTDKILGRNMVVSGKVKINRKTINDKTIEQKQWIELIKCN